MPIFLMSFEIILLNLLRATYLTVSNNFEALRIMFSFNFWNLKKKNFQFKKHIILILLAAR